MRSFLQDTKWETAERIPLAGDASSRQYTRLKTPSATALLMEDRDGDVALFARLAAHLRELGLSAPEVLSSDHTKGLLLIEDYGDGVMARLAEESGQERDLYALATDVLVELHKHPCPDDLPRATPERLAKMTDLAVLHYTDAPDARQAIADAFLPALEHYAQPADTMVLRDYHAENIMVLPDRSGVQRAGLLDFQDAMQGHKAYDLVSLVEDARRDVSHDIREMCIARYIAATGADESSFRASLAVLGAQRNLRILGVFARLAEQRAKPRYLSLIPRVWSHLQSALTHPELAKVRQVLEDVLPAPTPDHLETLKAKCPTL